MTKTEDKIAQQQISRMAELFLTDTDDGRIIQTVSNLISNPHQRKKIAYIIRDYCALKLRPEIIRFAGLMEMKLLKHDPARGQSWKSGDVEYHMERIRAIVEELDDAVDEGRKVGIKAADLANHAMMLADHAGELDEV